MQSEKEDTSPNLDKKHEESPKQSYSANVSSNPGKEHEKSFMQEKPFSQLYSPIDSANSDEHKITAKQFDKEDASPTLLKEHDKSLKQSDPANISPSLGKGRKKSSKQSDSVSISLNYSEEYPETENHSDMEYSVKLREEYQKAVKSVKSKRKRSLERVDISRDNADDESTGNHSQQLVPYNHSATDVEQGALVASDEMENNIPTFRNFLGSHSAERVLPSVGAFTVQCAKCFKWRLIPTKGKYQEIRETILQDPFTCGRAREWRPDITCEDPTDISQDGSRIWAIDKPNIAQPPPGWERILRIRGEGGTRFADVYYAAPSGKTLRSMVEIQRYLLEHPEYIQQGVNLSQFSFQIPRPLQENYVRKRLPPQERLTSGADPGGLEFSRPLGPEEVNPLSWAAPPTQKELEAARSSDSAS